MNIGLHGALISSMHTSRMAARHGAMMGGGGRKPESDEERKRREREQFWDEMKFVGVFAGAAFLLLGALLLMMFIA